MRGKIRLPDPKNMEKRARPTTNELGALGTAIKYSRIDY